MNGKLSGKKLFTVYNTSEATVSFHSLSLSHQVPFSLLLFRGRKYQRKGEGKLFFESLLKERRRMSHSNGDEGRERKSEENSKASHTRVRPIRFSLFCFIISLSFLSSSLSLSLPLWISFRMSSTFTCNIFQGLFLFFLQTHIFSLYGNWKNEKERKERPLILMAG